MKRYIMELIGTFFLTVAISLTGHPIAIGLMLMTMIYVGGHVSGGHFNPAVSFVMFLEKSLSLHGMLRYWVAQSCGAALALLLFMTVTNNMFVPEMAPGTSLITAMLMEALFVMVFCWICLTMTGNTYRQTSLQGIVIGLTLTAIAFIGGLFNPAVAVGSLVCNVVKAGVMIDFATIMIYVFGPLVGALAASYVHNLCNDMR